MATKNKSFAGSSPKTHAHHDPAFPPEARQLGERIASALERIADAQEKRENNQTRANGMLQSFLAQMIPQLLALLAQFGVRPKPEEPPKLPQ